MPLEQFLEKRKLDPIEFQGARIPVYKRWIPVRRKVGGASVYLVGDAAAQVKVSTVGGIVTGFRGAVGVAESILNGGESRELRRLLRAQNSIFIFCCADRSTISSNRTTAAWSTCCTIRPKNLSK